MVVCKDNLDKLKANRQMGMEAAAAVEGDIARLLSGKTYDGLVSLQRQVQAKLTSGEPIDNDYWETLLKKLLVWKAKVCIILSIMLRLNPFLKAKLKSFHEVVVRNRLEQLRKRQRDEALQAQEELLAGVAEVASAKAWIPKDPDSAAQALESKDEDVEEWDPSMEPPLLDITKLPVEERQVDILTAKEDLRSLVCFLSTISMQS